MWNNDRKLPTRSLIAVMLGLSLLSGCGGSGGRSSVGGRITRADGTPLQRAKVVFQSDAGVSCMAVTNADGRYQLGTLSPGDGAPLGTYAVVIIEDLGDDEDHPQAPSVHVKYQQPQTSGLVRTVDTGANIIDIVLELPGSG